MDERTLQALSKALTHLVFRNGVVENLHADSACLDDATMKKLNIDVNNRIYTVFDIWFNGTVEEVERLEYTLSFLAKYYGQGWDRAVRIDMIRKLKVGNTVDGVVLPAFCCLNCSELNTLKVEL